MASIHHLSFVICRFSQVVFIPQLMNARWWSPQITRVSSNVCTVFCTPKRYSATVTLIAGRRFRSRGGRGGGGYRILQESRGGGLLQYFSGVLWTKRKRLVCRVFRSMHPSGDFRAAQRYVDPYSGFCWYMQLFCFGNLQLYKVILIENSAKKV